MVRGAVVFGVLRAILVTGCLAAGCGRFAFDLVADGPASDAPGDQAPCDLTAPFGEPVAIGELNTAANEGSLRLLSDELTGYFHSSLDIFRAVRPDLASPFTFTLVTELSSAELEQEPTVTGDDLMIVFRKRVAGNNELFYATRTSRAVPFDTPALITALASSETDSQPFLSPGDGQLYFQSMRDGADEDIYRSVHNGTAFGAPVLLDELRANNEGDPVLSFDGFDMYWRSTRPGGPADGTFNIWTAHRDTLGDPFGAIQLVANVNSTANDGPSWLSTDGCRLYLTSNRTGNYDLFVTSRP